ncbi:oxidoreductase [Opitutaceae bacterium TAV5]|nr:oxidoreductase [Opitutaceae bacterium TAV5]
MNTHPLRVLVAGCGHMGTSHARAYHASSAFSIAGLVSRGEESRGRLSSEFGDMYPTFGDYEDALRRTQPDAVCISTWPDTHAAYATLALERGCHVFLEKPLAATLADAERVIALARKHGRKLMLGYILQHHPSWMRFVTEARNLGRPLVMRMNLNQQSSGGEWKTHLQIMQSMPPMVDCGVHYIDVMCRMTRSRPVRVHAIQARLDDGFGLPDGQCNYGQLQVVFADGSVGWYEAGWGPMMSRTAFFVKDVIGPRGSVSIAAERHESSDEVNAHTRTGALRIHHASLGPDGHFARMDEVIPTDDEPDHDELCAREQAFFAKAIREDLDPGEHLEAALYSLQVVLAAEESARTGRVITLDNAR